MGTINYRTSSSIRIRCRKNLWVWFWRTTFTSLFTLLFRITGYLILVFYLNFLVSTFLRIFKNFPLSKNFTLSTKFHHLLLNRMLTKQNCYSTRILRLTATAGTILVNSMNLIRPKYLFPKTYCYFLLYLNPLFLVFRLRLERLSFPL
jgi:hypothetical protein